MKVLHSRTVTLAKRPCSMFSMKQEFNNLLSRKKEFLARQQRSSLLIDPLKTKDNPLIPEFSNFYRRLSNAPMAPEDHSAQLALIEQVVQESIIIEWPKLVDGVVTSNEPVEIDMAPLIHRARSVVKCRTSHPTMRIKVCAITQDLEGVALPQPRTVEAFFRASLVKLPHDGSEPRQAAGRMILTQREGTPATKSVDQNGATVSDGKLLASQASPESVTHVLLERMGERHARTTPFKYDNHVLCATFPEMGVALNSMVDRRQLATRYAIQVEVAINIDNKLIVNHIVLSHPFLIAITNDQTEPLLYSIFWKRMLATGQNDNSELYTDSSTLPWSVLRQAIRSYVKSQITQARTLEYYEVCHLQCMVLLPRVIRCKGTEDLETLEHELYGQARSRSTEINHIVLRDRLLTEQVLPTTPIERREFMTDKCYSCLDMATELQHTVWSWLFRATEMIQDVGHKLCPSPNLGEKKVTKTKKQMAASEEYQTMLSLFNKGIITFASPLCARQVFQDAKVALERGAMLLRMCDENSGFFSFVFGFEDSSSHVLRMGSVSAEQVKDFKQGLPEVLIDEQFPSRFAYLVKIVATNSDSYGIDVSLAGKRAVFHSYETMRVDTSICIHDSESVRVNPLTGGRIERTSPAVSDHCSQPLTTFANLPSVSNALLSLIHHQMSLPSTPVHSGNAGGFDIRSLLRNISLPRTAEEFDSEGEEESEEGTQSYGGKLRPNLMEDKSSDEIK